MCDSQLEKFGTPGLKTYDTASFRPSTYILNEKYHSMLLTDSGHSIMAWRIWVWIPRVNSLIPRSKIEFWWLDPTHQ